MAGYIFGDVGLGLTIGVLLQLPYLIESPVGGCQVTFSSLGALVGAGLTLRLSEYFPEKQNVILLAGLLSGILLSWLLGILWRRSQVVNSYLVQLAEGAIDNHRFSRLTLLQGAGVLKSFLFGAGTVLVLMVGCEIVLRFALRLIPVAMDAPLALVRPAMIGAGLATLVRILVKKRTLPFALAGVGLATLVWTIT